MATGRRKNEQKYFPKSGNVSKFSNGTRNHLHNKETSSAVPKKKHNTPKIVYAMGLSSGVVLLKQVSIYDQDMKMHFFASTSPLG
mmetsp:Transcript_2444/g.4435  ORF Transcript_2444/g.4435 Transcript_2444/m.4435 type:complete len:85 (+) Transcript_2444:780-1034(+)